MKIEVGCPGCGLVSLTEDDVILRLVPTSTYEFCCPGCGDFIHRLADSRVVRLLISAGVIPIQPHVPAEIFEDRNGPPLTLDDLIDFHEELESDDWLKELHR